jgi:hypothetical protein
MQKKWLGICSNWSKIMIMRRTMVGFSFLLLFLVTNAFALSLKDSVDIALRNNPSAVASARKAEAADARLAQAVGAFFPTIKLAAALAGLIPSLQPCR